MTAFDSSTDTSTILYKVLTEAEHDALFSSAPVAGDLWPGTELDLKDGFIHSSNSQQLETILRRFFKNETAVHLLSIPRDQPRIAQTTKWDKTSDGSYHAHLYSGVDLATEVFEKRVLKREADGTWEGAARDLVY